MLNFELYNPVNYVFGKGQIEKLTDLVPSNTKILLSLMVAEVSLKMVFMTK